MPVAVAVVVALAVGFLAGLVTFKRSLRWCPGCGAVLRCPECAGRPSQAEFGRAPSLGCGADD